jgi:hypothetical protein
MGQEMQNLKEIADRFKADADEMYGVGAGDLTPNEEECIAVLESLGDRGRDAMDGATMIIAMSPEPVRQAFKDLLARIRENS